jgi:hypothetical protein
MPISADAARPRRTTERYDVVLIGHAEAAMQIAERIEIAVVIDDRGGQSDSDPTFPEAWDGCHDVLEAACPAEPVVGGRIVRVERELDCAIEVGEGRERVHHPVREQHPVRERDRRQDPRDLDERPGEGRQHEHLAARDSDRAEAERSRLTDGLEHRRRIERTAIRDARVRLGQAVGAGQIAVVGRIEPEPVAHAPIGDGTGERGVLFRGRNAHAPPT